MCEGEKVESSKPRFERYLSLVVLLADRQRGMWSWVLGLTGCAKYEMSLLSSMLSVRKIVDI